MKMPTSWFDRMTMPFAPRWTFNRQRARIASAALLRSYEAASLGRRTSGWKRFGGDSNASIRDAGGRVRDQARNLVRNNSYAESALTTIADHVVGWGITASPVKASRTGALRAPTNVAMQRWRDWTETTACDADGFRNFGAIQKQVTRTTVEAGECLVRRRWRRPEDGLPIPLQLQILEPDFIDSSKDGVTLPNGGFIIQGVQFGPFGRREGYWLLREHPGGSIMSGGSGSATISGQSVFVPASDVIHVFRADRPGQARGISWFANVMLRLSDLDDYEDAQLMKQKVAACLAVVVTDIDGTNVPLGIAETNPNTTSPDVDMLEPGMIANLSAGRQATVVQPPSVTDYDAYTRAVLRAIASGLGVTYEDLTGDYTGLPFSAARMSRLRHWARVEDWRWNLIIPQLCEPVWAWAMEAATIAANGALTLATVPRVQWTAPPMPLLEPDKEGIALSRLVRNGFRSWPEVIRELGYDPDEQLEELDQWRQKMDAKGIVLDCNPWQMSAQGQPIPATTSDPEQPSSESMPSANGKKPTNGVPSRQ